LTYLHIDISKDEQQLAQLVSEADVVVDLVAVANPSLYIDDPFGVYDLNYTQRRGGRRPW